jgi:hypothetical protein
MAGVVVMDKKQAEDEASAVSRWQKTVGRALKCDWCNGSGRQYAPIYDDPALGYTENGPCTWCNGTGKDMTKVF